MGDFIYELTEAGRAKAIDYKRLCAYVGPAPVPFSQYLQSVEDQTLRSRTPSPADLAEAFAFLRLENLRVLGSEDTTRKYLFKLPDGALIESVLIPASP